MLARWEALRRGYARAFEGRQTLLELLHIVAGLAAAAALTATFAWSYPLGRDVIWWCGAAAMLATVLMGIGPLRDARAHDRRDARANDRRVRA